MPRKGPAPRRELAPDPVYRSVLVTQVVNKVMQRGKRSLAERIVYASLDTIAERTGGDPLPVLKRAIENVKPQLEVRSRRVGGATYQVPVDVRPRRATTLAIRATRLSSAAAEKTLLYQLALSGVLLALAAPLAGEAWPRDWSALSIGSLLFQTVIVTFASYLVWFWLVRHYPATRIAAFTLLTPVAGLTAGVLLLGEPLTARLVIALLAVVAGLLLVNRR